MKRDKFVFNPKTLQYEEIKLTKKDKAYRAFGFLSAVIFTSILVIIAGYFYFPTPKEQALEREIAQLEYKYSNLSSQVEDMGSDLNELHQKDSEVHRLVFGLEPIDDNVWEGGVGGHDPNADITKYKRTGEMLDAMLTKVNRISRKMSIQEMSLDTIYQLALEREEKLASIPSIKPVQEDKLRREIRYLSGYGYRIHPIHKMRKFHHGIDFSAPTGTPIQATGNGKVVKVQKRKIGYGNNVTIDHGYGYQTLYAHMHEIHVKTGDMVKKGQKIGLIGNTGTSTGSHLHYEVRLNGKTVNPIDYCLDGLSPKEYQQLLKKAQEENQSFD